MAKKDLEAVVKDFVDLPMHPQIARRIINLAADENSRPEDIKLLIPRDPVLACKVLKLVNASYYGVPKRISNLNQAIVVLSFKTVRSVALSVSVMRLLAEPKEPGRFHRKRFSKHSIACACINRCVAKKNEGMDPELAFSFGLLHDIGKLILDEYSREEMDRIIDIAEKKEISFHEAEKEVLATDHADIGAWLAREWGLAESLVNAIEMHHTVEKSQDKRLVSANMFANYVCLLKGLEASGTFQEPSLDKSIWSQLNLKKADLPQIISAVNKEMKLVEPLLNP